MLLKAVWFGLIDSADNHGHLKKRLICIIRNSLTPAAAFVQRFNVPVTTRETVTAMTTCLIQKSAKRGDGIVWVNHIVQLSARFLDRSQVVNVPIQVS